MEKQSQDLKHPLEELRNTLQQHGDTDWRKKIPCELLQMLGLQGNLKYFDKTCNIYSNLCQNLTIDAGNCLKYLQETHVSHKDTVNFYCSVPALCGTLMSGRKNDVLQPRKQLVDVISEVDMKPSDCKPYTKLSQIDTLEEQLEVEKDILPEIIGRRFPSRTSDRDHFQSKSGDQNVKRAVAFYVIPVFQWKPRHSEVSLTGKAVKCLQKLETCMTSNKSKAKTICLNFFESYGSHFQLRMIHFGGIFEIEILFKERNIGQSEEKRKKFLENVLLTRHLCKLESPDSETTLSNTDCEEFELISTNSYQYGGASPVVTFPLWQKTLLKCGRSLTVVHKDRYENHELLGVWSLIEQKSEHFKDAEQLAAFVSEVWINLTHQNDERNFCNSIKQWKQDFLKKVEALANKNISKDEDLQILLQQLSEGESRYGYTPIQDALFKGQRSVETFLRRFAEFEPKSPNEEKHKRWHGLLNIWKKLSKAKHGLAGEILTWLQKYLLSEFVVLPCPLQDVESTSRTIETILLPAVMVIVKEKICQIETFFAFLTSTLQKSVSCALDKLLSVGNILQYLAMFSDALTLGYDIHTKEMKKSLTIDAIKEYSWRCKKTLTFFGTIKSFSASASQAWALKNIIFNLINKDCSIADSHSSAQGERGKLFSSIVKTMKKRGLTFDPEILKIVEQTQTDLDDILKRMVQISGISISYFEGDKRVNKPALVEDSFPECPLSAKQKPLLQILEKMNMKEFYPGKLTLQHVLKMHENQFLEPASFSELPWVMLRKIIAINFDFREKTLHDLLRKLAIKSQPEKKVSSIGQVVSSRKNIKTSEQYHPTDVFLALFQCFDPFLKKLVVQKMQVCQVAVPLVYQDYERNLLRLSLWPIREIFIDGGSESVATKHLQTVAFVRIGDKRKRSKSKLINQFLRSQNDEHSTFYHKDCSLGFHKRDFASGTVEASWFIPNSKTNNDDSDKKSEKEKNIEQPLTILNLRGNASTYLEQLQFLLTLASALVVIIDYEDIQNETHYPILRKIHASEAHVIIVTDLPHDEDETERFIQMYSEKTEFSVEKCSILSITSEGRYLNEIEVKQCLINDVDGAIRRRTFSMSLEEISEQLPLGFYSDEERPKSILGKQLCGQIISQIEGTQWTTKLHKKDILPLQGEALWHEWSIEQKEENRSRKGEFVAKDQHLEKMRILRVKQVCVFEQKNDIMAQFVDILVTYMNDKQTSLFFISWLRQYMDSRSRIILPEVLHRLREAFHNFENIRSCKGAEVQKNDEKNLEELKAKISQEERNLAQCSFGIEHFFREMGQLYEAFMYCQDYVSCLVTLKTREVIQSLPTVAAKLLLWGQPLEVMDGDAANVPLKWINAVFSEVSKIIDGEKKRLFSISVLGIQSSGKSTLLNTMFGLQFAVSAGRCTRGIYVQLVPINKKMSSLKFDYAMIIDTEGLRAPELAGEKVNHDNELATLVIGMGDVAIINIKGETIADMEDVLQIVVHAMIRLKQANEKITLKQSCIFVHQNVSAQDADKLTIQGNQKIIKNLDKMTVEVANEEHVANIRSFKDVIGFNPIKHVKYIPDLWHGTPPMAPASSQYSTSVIEVAKCILTDLTSDESQRYLSVENTKVHLQSLWKGILSENFVFSFRNVLEVKAYSLLEKKFQELTWQLEELKLKWLNDSVRPTLRKCIRHDELERHEREIYKEFSKTISSKTNAITKELERFFKESDLAEHMVHWKGRKNAELESTSREILSDIKHKLNVEKEKCRTLTNSNNCILQNKKEIQGKATEFARTLKGRKETPSEEEISKTFDDAWKQWVDDIVRDNPERDVQLDLQEMRIQIDRLLVDRFKKHEMLLNAEKIQKWGKSNRIENTMAVDDIKENHISISTRWWQIKRISFAKYQKKSV